MLPMGFDVAGDGSTVWGTESGAGSQILHHNDGDLWLEEEPGSPEVEFAEHGTVTKNFRTSYDNAIGFQSVLRRGTVVTDSTGNLVKILSCRVTRLAAFSRLTVVGELVNLIVPPDEIEFVPTALNVDIVKHPRYFVWLNPKSSDFTSNSVTIGDTVVWLGNIKQQIIRAIQTYREAPYFPEGNSFTGAIQNNIFQQFQSGVIQVNVPNTAYDSTKDEVFFKGLWDGTNANRPAGNYRYLTVNVPSSTLAIEMAVAAAMEIVSKIWMGINEPYIVGYKIRWTTYSFIEQPLNPGGYLEWPFDPEWGNYDAYGKYIPTSEPELPDYCYSTAWPPNANETVFDLFPYYNPTVFSSTGKFTGHWSMSCLRQADTNAFDRVLWRHTREWMCSPIGHWDYELFSQLELPTKPSDYVVMK